MGLEISILMIASFIVKGPILFSKKSEIKQTKSIHL